MGSSPKLLDIPYLAETPAAALLEVCVRTSANDMPPGFTLLPIETPRGTMNTVDFQTLPADWRERLDVTRDLGTTWLEANRTAALRVASAIVPETWDVLLNPGHPRAGEFRVTESIGFPFDRGLTR